MIEPNFGQTPEWLAFELDPATDRVALLRMTEEAYREASFLDQRILGPASEIQRTDWSALAAAVPEDARRDVQYIFHIGNVGSTLVSRLLGELDEVQALREPLLLRSFADRLGPVAPSPWPEAEAGARLDTLTAWLSRTFRPGQRAHRQGDQLHQRDRMAGWFRKNRAPCSCSRRPSIMSRISSPAKIRARRCR